MVEEVDGTFRCEECGMRYRDRTDARACEDYCREHGACSTEITRRAIVED